MAAFCAIVTTSCRLLGLYIVLESWAKHARRAPTKESPAPVTLEIVSIGREGKCWINVISLEFPCAIIYRSSGLLRLCVHTEFNASFGDICITTMIPRSPHLTMRCWKNGNRLTAFWIIPCATRKAMFPLEGSWSETGLRESCSRSIRNAVPRLRLSTTDHHVA